MPSRCRIVAVRLPGVTARSAGYAPKRSDAPVNRTSADARTSQNQRADVRIIGLLRFDVGRCLRVRLRMPPPGQHREARRGVNRVIVSHRLQQRLSIDSPNKLREQFADLHTRHAGRDR